LLYSVVQVYDGHQLRVFSVATQQQTYLF
jgi:hypothetical protein